MAGPCGDCIAKWISLARRWMAARRSTLARRGALLFLLASAVHAATMGNSASVATARQKQTTSEGGDTASPTTLASESPSNAFTHAPLSYFALDKLEPKGPRKNADVGKPSDFTRPLVKGHGSVSVGSWSCTEGGWDSPAPRGTTEAFYVLSGSGCVTDLDGTAHSFGPTDTVVLPKGWSGRWDVHNRIHKVWVVHDHADVAGASVSAVVTPLSSFAPAEMTDQGVRADAVHGAPQSTTRKVYDVGPTGVGCWTCTAGGWPVPPRKTTECFHVLEGRFFLTNADGTARCCQAGDTLMLPKGWAGHWDIIEPVKKVWVVVQD